MYTFYNKDFVLKTNIQIIFILRMLLYVNGSPIKKNVSYQMQSKLFHFSIIYRIIIYS